MGLILKLVFAVGVITRWSIVESVSHVGWLVQRDRDRDSLVGRLRV